MYIHSLIYLYVYRIGKTIEKYINIAYNLGMSKDLRSEVAKGIARKRDFPLHRIEVINDLITFFIYITNVHSHIPENILYFEYDYTRDDVDKSVYKEIINEAVINIRFFPSRPLLNYILAQYYCSLDYMTGKLYIYL